MIPAPLTPEQDRVASEEHRKLYPPERLVEPDQPLERDWFAEALFAALDDDFFLTRPITK